jgi:hypothetical protein
VNDQREREREQEDKLARALGELRGAADAQPPRDLWAGPAGIGARIEAKTRRVAVLRRGVGAVSVMLAAAAVALFVRTGAHDEHAQSVPRITRDTPVAPAPTAREPDHTPDLTPTLVPLVPEEGSYVAAASALELTLQDRETELPQKELASVRASLQALDAAIATTRTSLTDHPDDADLRAELDAEYEQKIDTMNDVLEWTTRS